jgi:hypothetical protein
MREETSNLDECRRDKRGDNGLELAIRDHNAARSTIDRAIDATPGGGASDKARRLFDKRLDQAIQAEQKAWLAFLRYPITSLEEARAKAVHVHCLLNAGDRLEKRDLELLLLSLT